MYLAIDTSTELTGLAVIQDGWILAQDNWLCHQNQSVELLPHLQALLALLPADIRDISGIIVARGPGSFNGLRVGLGTAKGLAFGLGVPIAGIGTLSALAYQHYSSGPVCAVMPAGRTEVAWGIFQNRHDAWLTLRPEAVNGLDELAAAILVPTVLAADLPPEQMNEITARLGRKAVLAPYLAFSRVEALAHLGEKRLAGGDSDDLASLQPLYLRRPPITLPASRTEKAAAPVSPAVIWDMDGVIVNSAPQHLQAWQAVFGARGVDFTEADFREYFGRVNRDIIGHFLGPGASEADIAAVAQEKEALYRSLAAASGIPLLPGVLELLQALHRRHIKQALASSAPRANIDLIMEMHRLKTFFHATVSAADVSLGKPDQQVFLIASRRLEAEPRQCVVIEDAVAGVAAGKAAGMAVIAVTNTNARSKLAGADMVVDSLAEITAGEVIQLMANK